MTFNKKLRFMPNTELSCLAVFAKGRYPTTTPLQVWYGPQLVETTRQVSFNDMLGIIMDLISIYTTFISIQLTCRKYNK